MSAYEDLIRVDTYDSFFREYSKRYFGPDFDWRIFKAQAIVESRLDPNAVSQAGAVGLMQILPKTYRQIAEENPDIRGDIRSPRWNIAAGIYYDKKLWNLWDAGRPLEQRLRFMLGAYNAGKQSILEAQQVAIKRKLNPYTWPSIERTLESVIGPEHRQTLYYVKKVLQIRGQMDGVKEASMSTLYSAWGMEHGERGRRQRAEIPDRHFVRFFFLYSRITGRLRSKDSYKSPAGES
ncbi:MAG: transglycosylase SLT domain-containing protein [Desulfobacterales bacterium]|nr:transglycosylase SLT domain-containing protein [Desulfobacterales bacterium]